MPDRAGEHVPAENYPTKHHKGTNAPLLCRLFGHKRCGWTPPATPGRQECKRCSGSGKVFAGPNGVANHRVECDSCGGTGHSGRSGQ